jgi:hypothetical protein
LIAIVFVIYYGILSGLGISGIGFFLPVVVIVLMLILASRHEKVWSVVTRSYHFPQIILELTIGPKEQPVEPMQPYLFFLNAFFFVISKMAGWFVVFFFLTLQISAVLNYGGEDMRDSAIFLPFVVISSLSLINCLWTATETCAKRYRELVLPVTLNDQE